MVAKCRQSLCLFLYHSCHSHHSLVLRNGRYPPPHFCYFAVANLSGWWFEHVLTHSAMVLITNWIKISQKSVRIGQELLDIHEYGSNNGRKLVALWRHVWLLGSARTGDYSGQPFCLEKEKCQSTMTIPMGASNSCFWVLFPYAR